MKAVIREKRNAIFFIKMDFSVLWTSLKAYASVDNVTEKEAADTERYNTRERKTLSLFCKAFTEQKSKEVLSWRRCMLLYQLQWNHLITIMHLSNYARFDLASALIQSRFRWFTRARSLYGHVEMEWHSGRGRGDTFRLNKWSFMLHWHQKWTKFDQR